MFFRRMGLVVTAWATLCSCQCEPTHSASSSSSTPESSTSSTASTSPKASATAGGSIGSAKMEPDGTIVLNLRAEGPGGVRGDGQLRYAKSDPDYQKVLDHLGGLKPGQSKPVPPWPKSDAGRAPADPPKGLTVSRKCGTDELGAVLSMSPRWDRQAKVEVERFAGTLSFLAHARSRLSRKDAKGAWQCIDGAIAELADKYLYGKDPDPTVEKLDQARAHAKKAEWPLAAELGIAVVEARLSRKSRQLRHYFSDFRVDQYEPGKTVIDEAAARKRATLLAERAVPVSDAMKDADSKRIDAEFSPASWKVHRAGEGWHLEIMPPSGASAEVAFDRFGGVPTVIVLFATE